MNKKEFYKLLKAVPKAELHIHEEAAISNTTIRKLYQKSTGNEMTQEALNQLFNYTDLAGFLKSFIAVQNLFTDIKDLRCVFDDLAVYLERNNITYCETFFSPTSHIKKGWSFDDLSAIIKDGVESIQSKTGRTVRVIIDVSRSFGLENAQNNLDLVLKAQNPYIIGIGLGGDEEKGPAKDYQSVFINAEKAGLHRVVHAGETVDSWSMKDAVNLLHAERLGHGISAAYDAEFMKELAATRLPLEVSPTSNTYTRKYAQKLKKHQIKTLIKNGVNVTLNTDDPTFFKVSLIDEYWNIHKVLHIGMEQIKQIILNGFQASFMAQEAKDKACNEVNRGWNEWVAAHPGAMAGEFPCPPLN